MWAYPFTLSRRRPSRALPRPQRGVGDFNLDGRMTLESRVVEYLPTITVTFPTGNTSKGLSTGSVSYDLDSRFQHDFGIWTPFFGMDVGNSLDNTNNPDVRAVRRPFLT